MSLQLKHLVQRSPLDVNIWVDRTYKPLEEYEVILEQINDPVPLAHQIKIQIINFEDWVSYDVSASFGTVSLDNVTGIITYTAPNTFPDDTVIDVDDFADVMTIKVTANLSSYTYLPDDTIIDADGTLNKVSDIWDGMTHTMQQKILELREEYKTYSSSNVMNGANFNIAEMFPSSAFQQSWKDEPEISGGIGTYENPHDIDVSAGDSRFFPKVNTEIIDGKSVKKVVFKPRNSNIDEAQGDALDGYRFPGAVGSSLTVFKGEDETEKSYSFKIPLGLEDVFPIIPDEILTLCIKDINVIPIFKGNKTGHTFEWEQISGDTSEIIWTVDPITTEITISIGVIQSDRVFRLWISKGSIYESYVDMILYATPRSIINGYQTQGHSQFDGGANLKLDLHETHPIVLTGERIWGKQMRVNILRKIR